MWRPVVSPASPACHTQAQVEQSPISAQIHKRLSTTALYSSTQTLNTVPELYDAQSLAAGLQRTDWTAGIHVKAATYIIKIDMTGQKLDAKANLNIIGSTELKKSLPHTNALSEEKLIRGMGVSLTFPPGFIPSTAWDKAAGGLGPDAPEKSPPAPSPAGCFVPPEPTSNPAVNSTGCRYSTKFHAAVKAGIGSNCTV